MALWVHAPMKSSSHGKSSHGKDFVRFDGKSRSSLPLCSSSATTYSDILLFLVIVLVHLLTLNHLLLLFLPFLRILLIDPLIDLLLIIFL